MKLKEVMKLNELNYPGNIGAMEMLKFYQVAGEDQKAQMREFIANNQIDKAWDLLQKVTKTQLQKLN